MENSHFLRRFLVATVFAVITMVGIANLSNNTSQAGDGYNSPWSSQNAPVFYGTTRMVLQKGSKFDLNDARMRVLARDFEDGDVTSKIQVLSNDVDTATEGSYSVVYSVSDSHGNNRQLTVAVEVVENEEGNYFEKTLYGLAATDYMTVTGLGARQMDKQVLGFMLRAGQKVEIKAVAGSAKLSLYAEGGTLAAQKSITSEWQSLTASSLSSLMAETPTGTATVAIRTDDDVVALPYYHLGDDENNFTAYWQQLLADGPVVGAVESNSMLFYVTTNDQPSGFAATNATLTAFDKLVAIYDELLGYSYNSQEPWNQNIRSKYFVRGAGNCSGTAVYTEGGIQICAATAATADGFKLNFAMAHALAHAYAGAGLIDESAEIDTELAVEILTNYAKTKSSLANNFVGAWPENSEKLNDLVKKLETKGYAETYAALAQLTRKLNASGTLTEHPLTERYETVTNTETTEDEQPEENPGENEKPEEGEGSEEDKQPSEDSGFEAEAPEKDVFTVIAEAPKKSETVEEKPVADENEVVVVSVVARTQEETEEAQTEDDADEETVDGTVDTPLTAADGAREITENIEESNPVPSYIIVTTIVIVAGSGIAVVWARKSNLSA